MDSNCPQLFNGFVHSKTMRDYFVYILSNFTKTTLYIGVTNDIQRRIFEHRNIGIGSFSSKYKTHFLVYYEHTNDIYSALMREKQLKKWRREKKDYLIEQMNPEWKDLSKEW